MLYFIVLKIMLIKIIVLLVLRSALFFSCFSFFSFCLRFQIHSAKWYRSKQNVDKVSILARFFLSTNIAHLGLFVKDRLEVLIECLLLHSIAHTQYVNRILVTFIHAPYDNISSPFLARLFKTLKS